MPAGRPAKPTELKLLQGNPGKRPLNQNEPKPDAASLEPPPHLDETALWFWTTHAPGLQRIGLFTELDVTLFTTACEQHSLYVRLYARVSKAPFGKVAKEATRRMNWALDERNRILAQFGFSPSARAKISISPAKAEDPFEALMRRKGGA